MILADIAHGETDTADVFFLVALILFVVAAIVAALRTITFPLYQILIGAGLASVALALMVL